MSLSRIFCFSLEDLGGLFSTNPLSIPTRMSLYSIVLLHFISPASLLMVLLKIPQLYSKLALAQSWTRRLF